MSLYSDDQPAHTRRPPYTQPYRSLFGGSSQDIDKEQYAHFPGDGILDYVDAAATTGGGLITGGEDADDDETYVSSRNKTYEFPPNRDSAAYPLLDSARMSVDSPPGTQDHPSSPPPYRPNRFHGTADLWLDLTRDDRETVESLEEIRARDLAAHLYNAHVLLSQGITEQNDGPGDTQLVNNLAEWTAWPMPSDDVPRRDERIRRLDDDRWTFRMKSDPRPSAELEESIIAFVLKTAKDRFRSREWDSSKSAKRTGFYQLNPDHPRSPTDGESESDLPRADGYLHPAHRAKKNVLKSSNTQSDLDDTMCDTEWEDERESLSLHQRPTFLADDDVAREKLRPLARNIITRFEQLLEGIRLFHGPSGSENLSDKSRSRGRKRARSSSRASDMSSVYFGHESIEDTSGPKGDADTNSVYSRAPSATEKGARTELDRSQSRGRKRGRITSLPSRPRNTDAGSRNPSNHRRQRSTSATIRLGLIDWKDTVGIASMMRLPLAVIQRATHRFSALSGEEMVVPQFLEGSNERAMDDVRKCLSTESNPTEIQREESLPSKLARRSPPTRTSSTRRRSTSRGDSMSKTALPSGVGGTDTKKALVCPFKKCSRHKKGFSRVWNLNQHLKNIHPNYRPRDGKSQTRSGDSEQQQDV